MTNKWIAHENVREGNKINLICFIFDGGSASYFSSWKYAINEDINIIPILYPVREKRRSEPMYEDMDAFVDDLVMSLEDIFRGRYAFFGYCSGAIMAYEAAEKAYELYHNQPEYGMIISSEAPEFLKRQVPHFNDENRERLFFEHLSSLPFMDEKTLHDKTFLDYYKPLFEAEHNLLESYDYKKKKKLSCDFDVIVCPDDPKVEKDKVLKWAELTDGNVNVIEKDGGHFLVDAQKEYIFKTLNERLSDISGNKGNEIGRESVSRNVPIEMTETEKKIVDIWEEVFGIGKFGPDSNFFLVGGDSLKAVRILNAVNKIYDMDVTINDVFEKARIREFATYIDELCTSKLLLAEKYIEIGEI